MKGQRKLILSIDGGGIRGVIPLLVLRHFVVNLGLTKFVDSVDVFAGTSTGAIISAGLMQKDEWGAHTNDVDSILDLYRKRGKQIFKVKDNRKHCSFPLKKVLEHNFGGMCLCDFQQHFLFPSFDLKTRKPFIFSDRMHEFQETTVMDMLLACSAIPGVFPAVTLGEKQLIDGLFVNKNPALEALHYARQLYPSDSFVLVSLGTGVLSSKDRDAFEEKAMAADSELQKMSQSTNQLSYFRFQPNLLLGSDAMDDGSEKNIACLTEDAENYMRTQEQKIQRLVDVLNEG